MERCIPTPSRWKTERIAIDKRKSGVCSRPVIPDSIGDDESQEARENHKRNHAWLYRISVVWDERDGELNVSAYGVHLRFDDDESWLLFPVVPNILFPDRKRLIPANLLRLMSVLSALARSEPEQLERKTMPEIEAAYRRYLRGCKPTGSEGT